MDKKNTRNWDLKSKPKIGLEINVKIKLRQILGSTMSFIINILFYFIFKTLLLN